MAMPKGTSVACVNNCLFLTAWDENGLRVPRRKRKQLHWAFRRVSLMMRQRYSASTPFPFISLPCEMFTMALHQVVLGIRLRDGIMLTTRSIVACVAYMCTHSHALTVYTLLMLFLMNYKQTLRPYTYIPLSSGLQPNDRPRSGKDKDTQSHRPFVFK